MNFNTIFSRSSSSCSAMELKQDTNKDRLHNEEKTAFFALIEQTGDMFDEDKQRILDVFLQTEGLV